MNTGGRYFRARDLSELEEIYSVLDELEPVEQDDETFRPTMALFYWPLAAGLLLSFLLTLAKIPFWSFWKNRDNAPISMAEGK